MVGFGKLFTSLLASATAVLAQDGNNPLAIIHPGWGEVVNAGDKFTITWTPSDSVKNVNLVLRAGSQNNLTTLFTIASNIEDNGKYEWDVPADTGSNTDHSIVISDSSNENTVNYSPYFTILAVGRGITSSGASGASGSQTASSDASAASGSGSASASASDAASASASDASAAASASGSAAASSEAASGSAAASGSGAASSEAASGAASGSASAKESGSSAAEKSGASSSDASKASSANGAANVAGGLLAGLAGAVAMLA